MENIIEFQGKQFIAVFNANGEPAGFIPFVQMPAPIPNIIPQQPVSNAPIQNSAEETLSELGHATEIVSSDVALVSNEATTTESLISTMIADVVDDVIQVDVEQELIKEVSEDDLLDKEIVFEELQVPDVQPADMMPQNTEEFNDALDSTPSESSSLHDMSSTGSDTFDMLSEDYCEDFPELEAKYQKKGESDPQDAVYVDVCYKPVYKTLKKLQMRKGPGSKFAAIGVVPANATIRVITEGLNLNNHVLVGEWWRLHVTHNGRKIQTPSKQVLKQLKDFSDWKTWAEMFLEDDEIESLLKHVAAANNKVMVAACVDGEDQIGWISKRKKSGVAIKRVFGSGSPVVEVSNLEDMLMKKDSLFGQALTEFVSSQSRDVEPKLSFYHNLMKKASGCAKVAWEGKWRASRERGTEVIILKEGPSKGAVRTGYYKPSNTAYLYFNTISKATSFIKEAKKEFNFDGVEVDFEFDYANLEPVIATNCKKEMKLYQDVKKRTKKREGESKEDFLGRVKLAAGIYSVASV